MKKMFIGFNNSFDLFVSLIKDPRKKSSLAVETVKKIFMASKEYLLSHYYELLCNCYTPTIILFSSEALMCDT